MFGKLLVNKHVNCMNMFSVESQHKALEVEPLREGGREGDFSPRHLL